MVKVGKTRAGGASNGMKLLRHIANGKRWLTVVLRRWKRKRERSGGSLRHPGYAVDPNPVPRKKRLNLSTLRDRIRQQRRIKREAYRPSMRKPGGNRRLVTYLLAGVITMAFLIGGAGQIRRLLTGIEFFKVRSLSFEGRTTVPEETLRELSGIVLHRTSLLGMDTAEVEARIEGNPLVKHADVSREWPSGVIVKINEHEPVALINIQTDEGTKLYRMDGHGQPYAPVMAGQELDYPIITGLDGHSDSARLSEIIDDIMLFLKKAEMNDPYLPAQSVSEIHVDPQGRMVVYLVEHPFPIFFGQGEVTTKYTRLQKVLEALYKNRDEGGALSRVEYIQMEYYDGKVLVAQAKSG